MMMMMVMCRRALFMSLTRTRTNHGSYPQCTPSPRACDPFDARGRVAIARRDSRAARNDVVVDFDSNDVPYYAPPARSRTRGRGGRRRLCSARVRFGSRADRLGRASARWGPWANGRRDGGDESETEEARMTRGAGVGAGAQRRRRAGRSEEKIEEKDVGDDATSSSSVKRG